MKMILLIILGGGLGSLARVWVSFLALKTLGSAFPYGTLVVNMIGSFAMGYLFIHFRGSQFLDLLKPLVLLGFLGGFTTFSSFAIDTFLLVEAGFMAKAMFYILASMLLSLAAVWLGVILASP